MVQHTRKEQQNKAHNEYLQSQLLQERTGQLTR